MVEIPQWVLLDVSRACEGVILDSLTSPLLTYMKVYLSLTASSAAVERTFSSASLTITKKRTRLSPGTAEAQIVSGQNRRFVDKERPKKKRRVHE